MGKTKAVAKADQSSNEIALTEDLDVFEAVAGAGLENVTSADILIPRLTILQALSPQLKKTKSEYISGAEEGDICDVGTGDLFESPVLFLPVHYAKVWIEWAPRDSGGGLVEIHQTDSALDDCTQNDRRQMINSKGNLISETAQLFGLNRSAGDRRCFIAFNSTQLKKAKKINTLAMAEEIERPDGSVFTPPLWWRNYELGTAPESNNQGEWVGWTISRGEKLMDQPNWKRTHEKCVKFREQLLSGLASADTSDLETTSDSGDNSDDVAM